MQQNTQSVQSHSAVDPAESAQARPLEKESGSSPHLCIAPACGADCDGCNSAISQQTARTYAIRYAFLRNDPPVELAVRRFPGETPRGCYLDGWILDKAIDAELARAALSS